jgi:hypothetical protein
MTFEPSNPSDFDKAVAAVAETLRATGAVPRPGGNEGDEILDLGPVLEDGIAEIKLERLVDLGNLSVKISRPQD